MSAMIARFLVVCGGSLACVLACAGIIYSAWIMSRRDHGWDQ